MHRWIPALAMMLVSTISYIDRATLALLAPTILRETNMSGQQYGWIISGFSIIYLFANPIWGRWLDRIGLRTGMTIAVSGWTLASAAHAFASSFGGFALVRGLLGFGEGATFPGGMRTVIQSLPKHEQARGIGVAYSGASAGALLTPLIITPVALAWGWRAAFLFTGIIGALWLAVWSVVSRRPELSEPPQARASDVLSLRDRRIWAFILINGLGMVPAAFVLYQAANYLHQALGLTQGAIGAVLWIPAVGWEIGNLFFGWLVDQFAMHGMTRPAAVRRAMTLSAALALVIAAVPWMHAKGLVLAGLATGMFLSSGMAIPSLAYASYVFPARNAGFVAGLASAALGAASTITMPIFGRLFDLGRYDLAFVMAAACPIAGYLFWLWLAAERPNRESGVTASAPVPDDNRSAV
jgi:MFS transporter, ACS family, hexuronate transporter